MSEDQNQKKANVTLILGGARSGKSGLAEKLAGQRAGPTGVLYVATLYPFDEEMRQRVVQHQASRPPEWRTLEAPYDLTQPLLDTLQTEQVVLLDCLTVWTGNLIMRESEGAEAAAGDILATRPGEVLEEILMPTPPSSALEPDREENITSDLQFDMLPSRTRLTPPPVPAVRRPDYQALEGRIMVELETLLAGLRQREVGLVIVSNEVGMGLVPPYPMGRAYRDLLGRVNQRLAGLADEVLIMFAGLPLSLK